MTKIFERLYFPLLALAVAIRVAIPVIPGSSFWTLVGRVLMRAPCGVREL